MKRKRFEVFFKIYFLFAESMFEELYRKHFVPQTLENAEKQAISVE